MSRKDGDKPSRGAQFRRDDDSSNIELERGKLLEFFRSNIQDIPQTTAQWFELKGAGELLIERIGIEAVVAQMKSGVQPQLSPPPSEEAGVYIEKEVDAINIMIMTGTGLPTIDYASQRLVDAGERFSGYDLQRVRAKLFALRGSAQGYFLERGVLRTTARGSKIRSFASLSLANDSMKADIEAGYVTDRWQAIAEGFGYAQMHVIQHRAIQKMSGSGTNLVYSDTLRSIPKISVPADAEVADIQRSIVSRLQGIM